MPHKLARHLWKASAKTTGGRAGDAAMGPAADPIPGAPPGTNGHSGQAGPLGQ
jgi:hypothetical protein